MNWTNLPTLPPHSNNYACKIHDNVYPDNIYSLILYYEKPNQTFYFPYASFLINSYQNKDVTKLGYTVIAWCAVAQVD